MQYFNNHGITHKKIGYIGDMKILSVKCYGDITTNEKASVGFIVNNQAELLPFSC